MSNVRPLLRRFSSSLPAFFLVALSVLAHGTSIWFADVSTLSFRADEVVLSAEHNGQLARVSNLLKTKCAPDIPVVALTAVMPNDGKLSQREVAGIRIAKVKQALLALGIPQKAMYEDVYTLSQYQNAWSAAPERAQAGPNSVEIELACHPN